MPPRAAGVSWTNLLLGTAAAVETELDRLRWSVRSGLGLLDPVVILPYRGHGDAGRLRLRGRVLETRRAPGPQPGRGAWGNLLATLDRFSTDELPHARLRAMFGRLGTDLVTDEEGYFTLALDLPADEPAPAGRWRRVGLELLAPPAGDPPVRADGAVLVPDASVRFGVISDIDDTIIQTGAYDLVRNWRTVLLESAETRLPFRGVAAFYRALERGRGPVPANPLFYVSSSPWNLYDLLEQFMALHGIPAGPMYLRDFGLDRAKLVAGSHHAHKLGVIEELLAFYPRLGFILVGDSGQHDAAIYAEVVRRHPGRILAVYLRDVTASEIVDCEARAFLEEVRRGGASVAFCPDLLDAAVDAAARGWITADAVAEVRREVERR